MKQSIWQLSFWTLVILGLAQHVVWAESMAPTATPARAGNILFKMHAEWTRKEAPGATLLCPPALQGNKWYELRLLPGEESLESAQSELEKHVAILKQKYTVLEATPIKLSRNKGGWDGAGVAMTINVAEAGKAADLRFWVVYVARAGSRVQPLYYVSNDYDVYVQQGKTVEKFIDEIRFANLIILAEGAPALSQLFVYEVTDFLEWLVDVPFTDAQRQYIHDGMLEVWQSKDQKGIDSVMQLVNLRRQIAALSPEQAEFARARAQGEAIAMMRKDVNSGLSQLLVGIYDAGHKPIAQGEPALTRQAADAMLEITYFMASAIEGGQAIVPTKEEKDQWAAKLAEQYPKMPDPQRKSISQMPMIWAALRWAWPNVPDAEKDKLKAQFASFEPVKQVRQTIAAARKAKQEDFAAAMRRLQSSHESFMMLSNMSYNMHMTNMAAISNIGGNTTYRYEYRYRY